MKILIADDEPLARQLIESYVLKMPDFELAGTCANALEAFSILNRQPVDLVFLDINMPEISGIDFIRALKHPPKVIFTTAYSEFAVESYNLNAVDYLLKPITFERFMKGVNKATDLFRKEKEEGQARIIVNHNSADNLLFIKSEGKMVKIDLNELWFVEGLKNYIRLWTNQGKIIVHGTMKSFEDQLTNFPFFVRINKSFIVNLNFVTEIDGNVIRVKGEMLTIGNTYRDDVQKIIDRYKFI
jgi:DNA-binding LytR/AlgR family response regulator